MQMVDTDLLKLLERTGIPVKYRNIEPDKKMTLPFIGFHFLESDNMSADNKVYFQSGRYSISLCIERRNKKIEKTLEQILDDACIFWDKYETYIAEERMYQITYEVEL